MLAAATAASPAHSGLATCEAPVLASAATQVAADRGAAEAQPNTFTVGLRSMRAAVYLSRTRNAIGDTLTSRDGPPLEP